MSARPGCVGAPIWELAKPGGRLIVAVREFKGARFIDLRLWAGERGDTATKKGVTIPLSDARHLADALLAQADRLAAAELESGA